MAEPSHKPDDRDPLAELPDVLRSAVEGIRRSTPPSESRDRACDRARRLKRPKPWLLRRVPLFVSSAVAAGLLLILLGRYGTYPFGGYLASTKPEKRSLASTNPVPPPPVDPPIYLTSPRLPTHGLPREVYQAVALDRSQSPHDRAVALRTLAQGMPVVDRAGLESYLRRLSQPPPEQRFLVYNQGTRPLPQARILTADKRELQLQGVTIQVRIEGPRARTLVDHIFHNQEDTPVEGTFEFPVPDGASPSHFTLFPGNKGNAKVIQGDAGPKPNAAKPVLLPAPREAVNKVDPGCWGEPQIARIVPGATDLPVAPEGPAAPSPEGTVAPNTFRGPIGLIAPKSHLRILFAFEETLPLRNGKLVYEYPLPACTLYQLSLTIQTDAVLGGNAVVTPSEATRTVEGGQVTYRCAWNGKIPPKGSLRFEAAPADASIQSTSGKHADGYCLLARLRPDVPSLPADKPFARHAVFLLDTSAGESAPRFHRCIQLMRAILEQDPAIERFNVLTFNSAATWLEPAGWLANTKQAREEVLGRLDGLVLEGATDLSVAVKTLLEPPFSIAKQTPLHCFLLSEGKLTAGDSDVPTLVARLQPRSPWPLRWHCYQTGLGEENAELFALLTRQGGGVYRCASEKDVPAAARAHSRPCLTIQRLRIEGNGKVLDQLVAGRRSVVYPGGEVLLGARFQTPGQAQIVLEGTIADRRVVQRFPVVIGAEGTLAARGWAELAVASLLALRDPRLEPEAVWLARSFAIPSRVTSFALAPNEPEEPINQPVISGGVLDKMVEGFWWALAQPPGTSQRRSWLRGQLELWVATEPLRRDIRPIVDLLPEKELTLPDVASAAPAVRPQAGLADLAYRAERKAIAPYLAEADRRRQAGDVYAAVRCLGSLLEEHAGNAEVARLVSWHLLSMEQPAAAARQLADLLTQSPRDPATHRALAVALEECGRPIRAALHYEIALAQLGENAEWYAAVRDEFAHLLRKALRQGELSGALRSHFTIRLNELDRQPPAGLRVTATWNVATSQVGLVVKGPDGKAQPAPALEAGTIGVQAGPRRVQVPKLLQGDYVVEVELARASSPETVVTVQIARNAGSGRESIETKRVQLRQVGEKAIVATIKP